MIELHDLVEANIECIFFNSTSAQIEIGVVGAWDERLRKKIIANGVDDFIAVDVRASNVIDRVMIFDARDLNGSFEVERLVFFLMRGIEMTDSDLSWPSLLSKIELIRNGDLKLVEITPVYGAKIIVLAKTIDVT